MSEPFILKGDKPPPDVCGSSSLIPLSLLRTLRSAKPIVYRKDGWNSCFADSYCMYMASLTLRASDVLFEFFQILCRDLGSLESFLFNIISFISVSHQNVS